MIERGEIPNTHIVEYEDSEMLAAESAAFFNPGLQDQEPGPSEPIYLGYWPNQTPHLEEQEDRKKFGKVATENFRSSRRSRQRLEALSNSLSPSNDCFSEIIRWYKQLGALNQLVGGAEDLNRAYDLLQASGEQSARSRRQFMAGCLRHEAALIATDPEDKERWLADARFHYERVIDRSSFGYAEQTAIRLWHDVRFESLFDRARQLDSLPEASNTYQRLSNGYFRQELQLEFDLAQLDYIDDFETMCQLRDSSPKHEGMMGGRLFEWFCVLAYRDLVARKNKIGETTIRTAFPREDRPEDDLSHRGLPKQANDMVITHHDSEGEIRKRYSVQQKVNGRGCYADSVKRIKVKMSQRKLVSKMRHAAQLIEARTNRGKLNVGDRKQLDEIVDELIEPELVEV